MNDHHPLPAEETDVQMQATEDTPEDSVSKITNSPIITNFILAFLFLNSFFLHYNDYSTNHKFSSLLMMILTSCIILFFLIRVAPSKVSMAPQDSR